MTGLSKVYLILLLVVLWDYSSGQCTCSLQNSTKYPDTFKWDCNGKGLTYVPFLCWDERWENVTEVLLQNNFIANVVGGDFDGLLDVKDIHLEYNPLTTVASTAFADCGDLRYINLEQDNTVQLPTDVFANNPLLEELRFLATHVVNLPDLTTLLHLNYLDCRSCELGPLARPTFGELVSTTFLLNLYDNDFIDIAADIILPIPELATLQFDTTVIIWAKDIPQEYDVKDKNWNINLDMEDSIMVCDYDGTPTDPNMC